jgi:signal transduction histidine kinase
MGTVKDHDFYNSVSHFAHVINHINTGIWEVDVNTNEVKWSDGFYKLLGYEPNEIECSAGYFFEHLLYHEDRAAFAKAINGITGDHTSTVQVRLATKNDGYQWFENTSKRCDDTSCCSLHGAIININPYKLQEAHSAQKDLLFKEMGRIAKVAVWELEISTMKLQLSKEAYDIFGLNNPVKLSIDEAVSFFEPLHRDAAANAIENATKNGKPFDLELQFRTARNKVTWLRFKAIPFIDNFGKCIKLTGILQDINHAKKREMALKADLSLSADQNRRLQNFAYIVSHNLRSHTGNLKFMVNLFSQPDADMEREEIFEHIKSISDSLNTTVEHLEEVVKIQAEITKDKKIVEFEPLFKNIISALNHNINEADAKIEFDFTKCPEINYIPAYMESILQNLLTNSLKYKADKRKPHIKCHTYNKNRHDWLIFEDNGMGIDLEKHGNSIFGMYETFHQNKDAKGIGLFITRNQVESLGGAIKLESTVDVGTKFTIRLN